MLPLCIGRRERRKQVSLSAHGFRTWHFVLNSPFQNFVSAEIVPRCFPTTTSFPSIKAESRFKAMVMEDKTILPKIPFQCKRRAILYPSSKIYPRFYSLLILILLLSSKIYKADLKSKNEKKSNKKSVLEHCFIGILFCPIPSDPYQPCPYLTVYSLPSVLCKLILNSPFQVLLKIYQIYIYTGMLDELL